MQRFYWRQYITWFLNANNLNDSFLKYCIGENFVGGNSPGKMGRKGRQNWNKRFFLQKIIPWPTKNIS